MGDRLVNISFAADTTKSTTPTVSSAIVAGALPERL